MVNSLLGKDFIATSDWTKNELDQVLHLAYRFKHKRAATRSLDILKGRTLLLLFFRSSTRTMLSFTAAMHELGGFVQCPNTSDLRLDLEEKPGGGESIKDTARVVERYVDAVGIRLNIPLVDKTRFPREGGGEAVMQRFADYTEVPVINMSGCLHHPTQAIADVMVMQEKFGELNGKKITIMWAYSPYLRHWATPLTDALISATYGMNVSLAYPEGYDLDPETTALIQKECVTTGGKFEITHDFKSALRGADVVFPRNWRSPRYYVHTREKELHLAAQHRDWKFTESLLPLTSNARFMHVMPFDRGNEVDDSIADGPNSIVYDQAENLLYVRKALLCLLLLKDINVLKHI